MELVYTPADGTEPTTLEVYNFDGKTASGGVALSMYNTEEVLIIKNFLCNQSMT